jgi:hypothetical protein
MSVLPASVYQRTQLGVEVTRGTVVAANRRLRSLSFGGDPTVESTEIMIEGSKLPGGSYVNREWTTAPITGALTYTEIIYALASLFGKATPELVATSTAAYDWVFAPSAADDDDPQTFTLERGSSIAAIRAAYLLVTGLTMNFARGETGLTGEAIAQLFDTSATMTASPTTRPVVPILPAQYDVYMDPDYADIGTTQLTRAAAASMVYTGKYGPYWAMDSSEGSWAEHVDLRPTQNLTLQLPANSAGDLFTEMRAGAPQYIRIAASGPANSIETGFGYEFELDFCGTILNPSANEDRDGAQVRTWTFVGIEDADLNPLSIRVRNGIATL